MTLDRRCEPAVAAAAGDVRGRAGSMRRRDAERRDRRVAGAGRRRRDAAGALPGPAGHGAPLRARSSVDLHGAHIGSSVVLMFEHGDADSAHRDGRAARTQRAGRWQTSPAQVEVDADGERMIVSAKEQLVLRCGKASITLTKAGKVLIEGSYVLEPVDRREPHQGRLGPAQLSARSRGTTHGTDQRHPHGRRLHHGPGAERPRAAGGRDQGHLRAAQAGRAGAPGTTSSCRWSWPTPSPASRASARRCYEVDFAPRKHACDVLLLGSAHAPEGRPGHASARRPARRADGEGVRRGRRPRLAGRPDRHHARRRRSRSRRCRSPTTWPSAAPTATAKTRARTRRLSAQPGRPRLAQAPEERWVDGAPLPNTEETGQAGERPERQATGRWPSARSAAAGRSARAMPAPTTSSGWTTSSRSCRRTSTSATTRRRRRTSSCRCRKGPMDVVLSDFTADGARQFMLPHFEAPVHVFPKRGEREDLHRDARHHRLRARPASASR